MLIPQAATGHLGWARGAIGALLGIGLSALVTALTLRGDAGALPILVAPLGASAVLVFAVPASPLAQPWPVIGGDLLSAMIGLAIGHMVGVPWLAGAIAVGCAIAVMSVLRCLHPPGGACALLCALNAAGAPGWTQLAMLPIVANVLALAAVGYLYNNLTGHPWPHRPVRVPRPATPLYEREDLEAVLADWGEVLDVDVDELDAIFQALQRRVASKEAQGKPG